MELLVLLYSTPIEGFRKSKTLRSSTILKYLKNFYEAKNHFIWDYVIDLRKIVKIEKSNFSKKNPNALVLSTQKKSLFLA